MTRSTGNVPRGRVTTVEALSSRLGVPTLEEVAWVVAVGADGVGEASLVHIRLRPPQPAPVPGRPETSRRRVMPPEPKTLCGQLVGDDVVMPPRDEDDWPRCRSCHRASQRYNRGVVLERM